VLSDQVASQQATAPQRTAVPSTGARTALEPIASQFADLATAGRYLPAGLDGESLGGDFFDLFRLDDFRLLVAVGDVAGHGPGAFARMTWLRASTRAFSLDPGSTPEGVLRHLDAVQSWYEPEDIATLWVGMYDPRTGVLRYASAGHLPPVLAPAGGPAVLLEEASGPPLGTGAVARHVTAYDIVWPHGAVLVAYSDGLVERPAADLDQQISMLRDAVQRETAADPAAALETLVEGTLAAMLSEARNARDDVCVLALRRLAASD
jgi:serine phosphatase RsbU (regulator of sigma subunit)